MIGSLIDDGWLVDFASLELLIIWKPLRTTTNHYLTEQHATYQSLVVCGLIVLSGAIQSPHAVVGKCVLEHELGPHLPWSISPKSSFEVGGQGTSQFSEQPSTNLDMFWVVFVGFLAATYSGGSWVVEPTKEKNTRPLGNDLASGNGSGVPAGRFVGS